MGSICITSFFYLSNHIKSLEKAKSAPIQNISISEIDLSGWEEVAIAGKTAYICIGPPQYFPDKACHYVYFRGKGWMALPIKDFSEVQVAMILTALNDD